MPVIDYARTPLWSHLVMLHALLSRQYLASVYIKYMYQHTVMAKHNAAGVHTMCTTPTLGEVNRHLSYWS